MRNLGSYLRRNDVLPAFTGMAFEIFSEVSNNSFEEVLVCLMHSFTQTKADYTNYNQR